MELLHADLNEVTAIIKLFLGYQFTSCESKKVQVTLLCRLKVGVQCRGQRVFWTCGLRGFGATTSVERLKVSGSAACVSRINWCALPTEKLSALGSLSGLVCPGMVTHTHSHFYQLAHCSPLLSLFTDMILHVYFSWIPFLWRWTKEQWL